VPVDTDLCGSVSTGCRYGRHPCPAVRRRHNPTNLAMQAAPRTDSTDRFAATSVVGRSTGFIQLIVYR